MIVLFTDYGLTGPYLGQVESVLCQQAPEQRVINLFADVPRQDPQAGAYLLSVLATYFPAGSVFLCVVDPGVGNFDDDPVILNLDGSWFVGPDNGLFDIVARGAVQLECWKINWRPEKLSSSFHGRDLYAPVAAMIANGLDIPGEAITWEDRHHWPDDLDQVIYIDHFGNCMTGMRAVSVAATRDLLINEEVVSRATTFSDVAPGEAFWYENSLGLVEIAVNQGNAADKLGLTIGSGIRFQ